MEICSAAASIRSPDAHIRVVGWRGCGSIGGRDGEVGVAAVELVEVHISQIAQAIHNLLAFQRYSAIDY